MQGKISILYIKRDIDFEKFLSSDIELVNTDFSLYLFNTINLAGCYINFYKVVFIQYCNLY